MKTLDAPYCRALYREVKREYSDFYCFLQNIMESFGHDSLKCRLDTVTLKGFGFYRWPYDYQNSTTPPGSICQVLQSEDLFIAITDIPSILDRRKYERYVHVCYDLKIKYKLARIITGTRGWHPTKAMSQLNGVYLE